MGGKKPITAKLFSKLKIANIITISPAVLKKIPDFELFLILNELKLMRASTGSVPNAKESMVRPPVKNPPVDKVYICIDCVKPQGKKKVTIPTKSGVSALFHFETPSACFEINFGIAG